MVFVFYFQLCTTAVDAAFNFPRYNQGLIAHWGVAFVFAFCTPKGVEIKMFGKCVLLKMYQIIILLFKLFAFLCLYIQIITEKFTVSIM